MRGGVLLQTELGFSSNYVNYRLHEEDAMSKMVASDDFLHIEVFAQGPSQKNASVSS